MDVLAKEAQVFQDFNISLTLSVTHEKCFYLWCLFSSTLNPPEHPIQPSAGLTGSNHF